MSASSFKVGDKVKAIGASECVHGCCRAESFIGFIVEINHVGNDGGITLFTIREQNEGPMHKDVGAWRLSRLSDGL